MITRIARLRAKKGFTIIELVVVMAVIGVLTAIVVAAMSYDQRPIKGKGIAKDFFYAEQDAFCSAEITEPIAIEAALSSGGSTDTYTKYGIYISVNQAGMVTNSAGEIDKWGTVYVSEDKVGAMPVSVKFVPKGYNSLSESDTDKKKKMEEQIEKLNERLLDAAKTYLESMTNMSGTLIVLADAQYRCVAAYWTDQAVNDDSSFAIGSAGQFIDHNHLDNGFYYCAYPAISSMSGRYLFNTDAA